MELKAVERMLLLSLLSDAAGDVTMLRIVRDTQEKLGFTEEELEALAIKQVDTQVQWNKTADQPVDIPIGRAATKVISDKLERLNAEKRLTVPQIELYDKFCPDGVEEDASVR